MKRRVVSWSGVVIGLLVTATVHAVPMPLVKASAGGNATRSFQLVGNGVYPAINSSCYANTSQWPTIPFTNGGIVMTAPIVVGVFWPGAQSPDPYQHALFGDFVTDLLNGPYWSAAMSQYMGSAHGIFHSSVDLPTLLTLQPSTTIRTRTIAGELLAQQAAGVLPPMDPQMNTIYVVHFPPGTTIIDSTYEYIDFGGRPATHVTIGTSCLQYCAYHDEYINPSPFQAFAFVVMPDMSSCQAGCGSGTPIDVYTKVLSHELLETVSDPYGTGWLNSCVGGEEEIADVCGAYLFRVPRRTATPGTPQCPNRWAMSAVFSNAAYAPGTANGCLVADATPVDCTLGVVPEPGLAATLELSAPSPNPAARGTQFRYSLPFASFVRLSVTDVTGRQVTVLDRRLESPGAHSAAWDGRDADGNRAPAGVYFVRLESGGQSQSRKIVLDR